jgi:serine phosphatase RsbU (regulator of sigma subunit)
VREAFAQPKTNKQPKRSIFNENCANAPGPRLRHAAQHEFYGVSAPSGEMGGDLVDVVEDSNKRIGYLADVSGHGVPSDVLIAMVKSAVRMRLATSCEAQLLLEDLNRVISELTAAEMFVTMAFVALGTSELLLMAQSGHRSGADVDLAHACKLYGDYG